MSALALRAAVGLCAVAAWAAAMGDGEREYEWALPPGFPKPVVPADNPMSAAKVALGCRLFFEPRLSATGTYSCASCHRPEKAFTDGLALATGATGATVQRGAMSLANVAYSPAYTWADDHVATLEAQMERPLFNDNPVEMGLHRNDIAALEPLAQDPAYVAAFRESFPADRGAISLGNVIKAIAAYERTLISGRSPFDRYVYDDERTALTPLARRGMELFFSASTGCAQCHSGINFSGPIRHRAAPDQQALFANNGTQDARSADTGLMAVSGREQDRGKFRVPTLRNIELTAPYMHDGRFATLEAVIDHYAAGGPHDASGEPQIKPLNLTPADKAALFEFLRSLTDSGFGERATGSCAARRAAQ